MRYTIAITEKDGVYSATVVELPGCKSEGGTVKDSVKGIKERITEYTSYVHDEDAVFRSDDSTYYYTVDDKRASGWYLSKRLLLLFVVFVSVCILSLVFSWLVWSLPPSEIVNPSYRRSLVKGFATIVTILATIWAIQSYWRLRYVDRQSEKWRPHGNVDEWSGPFTFHSLAESHKQWAELWFSWCAAIFAGGVTYAIYNLLPPADQTLPPETWPGVLHEIVKTQAPNGFIYVLFGVSWYWASKHYRSHWHNFVINAYRHRALYRFESLRKKIIDDCDVLKIWKDDYKAKAKAQETILELYRLSGALLLIPGDSSYLDKVGGEELAKSLVQISEVVNALPAANKSRDLKHDSHGDW
jgi:predicted RNase H-like HicB family nuclease